MNYMRASNEKEFIQEFGDFQTPDNLAIQILGIVKDTGIIPNSIIEPTCGVGSFLFAANKAFPKIHNILGVDINQNNLNQLKETARQKKLELKTICADFFKLNWVDTLKDFEDPVLIIGNPPWVTNSKLGILESSNLPKKSNFSKQPGLAALTGKSNFDISESMILDNLKWLRNRTGVIAMLCKTSVARKVILYAWKHGYKINNSRIYKIDAGKHFGVTVDACLLLMQCNLGTPNNSCFIYNNLDDSKATKTIGYLDGEIIADLKTYEKYRHLISSVGSYTWRSGIKHDCSKIMELEKVPGGYINGSGEKVDIEDIYLYPMYKSSDLGNGERTCKKYMIVTQKRIGEETRAIKTNALKTWKYLLRNSVALDKRLSSIYQNKPRFSVFGVGDYTFFPWKVAISGFYKKLEFKVVGPIENKPVVFDDTIYFLPCESKIEAEFIAHLLNSQESKALLNSIIFWDNKRPITIDILKRINIQALANALGVESKYISYTKQTNLRSNILNSPVKS